MKEFEKQKPTNSKRSRWREIMSIRAKINEVQMKTSKQKITLKNQ